MADTFLDKLRGWSALPLRIGLGVIFIAHGSQKLFGIFGGHGLKGTAQFLGSLGFVPGILWAVLLALGEFLGGIFILFGFLTRLGALMIAGAMLVAIIRVHLPHGFFNSTGGIEFPLILFASALSILFSGPQKLIIEKGK